MGKGSPWPAQRGGMWSCRLCGRPLLEGVLAEHSWDWYLWVVPLGSSSPWVIRERRGEHPNPCSFLALPLWQARGTPRHLLFPPTQLAFPDGLHAGPACPTAAVRARTTKMGASGVTEGHCLEPALLPPTLSGV